MPDFKIQNIGKKCMIKSRIETANLLNNYVIS